MHLSFCAVEPEATLGPPPTSHRNVTRATSHDPPLRHSQQLFGHHGIWLQLAAHHCSYVVASAQQRPKGREYRRLVDATGGQGVIVAAMFTANLMPFADRLRASLEQFDLPFVLREVPMVHRSISPRGSGDINYCKPAFIERMLNEHGSVLYVDADVVFRAPPSEILRAAKEGVHFASYNWLADDATDAYLPIPMTQFYRFSHSVDSFDPSQLVVSGPVQFYSGKALPLLRAWLDTIRRFPNVTDDESLDYAFNFMIERDQMHTRWLGKEYCRYPWWPHIRPVIDHPEFPATADPRRTFNAATGHERFDTSRVEIRPSRAPFPRDRLIDMQDKLA
jgi:hypothetical protein